MKTKITTITFIAILSVLPITAQESYLPVFGEGVTRFYLVMSNMSADCGGSHSHFDCIKDMENENIYHAVNESGYPPIHYPAFEVSEDNSKLWGHYPIFGGGTHTDLLMDLNLNVGDKFKGFTVAKVYYKEGRKHIEFEEPFDDNSLVCMDENNIIHIMEFPFMFIEGIGPNAFVQEASSGYPGLILVDLWLYAQHRNGEFEYGIKDPYFPECEWSWDIWAFCPVCKARTGIRDVKIKTFSLVPNPSDDKVQVILPETVTEGTTLTVSDLSGRIIETVTVNTNSFALDISRYAPATYIICFGTNDYQYVGKIIKK